MTAPTFESKTRRRFLAALALAVAPGTDGERCAAEAALGRLVVAHAPAFRALLQEDPPWPQPEAEPGGWRDLAARCLARRSELTYWEAGFVSSLMSFRNITEKQRRVLLDIAAKLTREAGA